VSSHVTDGDAANNVQQELSVLSTLVGEASERLGIMESVPKKPRPVGQTVKEADRLYHEGSFAAHTLHDVLEKTKTEIAQRSEEPEYLGFYNLCPCNVTSNMTNG
jgi:hypothetical protein